MNNNDEISKNFKKRIIELELKNAWVEDYIEKINLRLFQLERQLNNQNKEINKLYQKLEQDKNEENYIDSLKENIPPHY